MAVEALPGDILEHKLRTKPLGVAPKTTQCCLRQKKQASKQKNYTQRSMEPISKCFHAVAEAKQQNQSHYQKQSHNQRDFATTTVLSFPPTSKSASHAYMVGIE